MKKIWITFSTSFKIWWIWIKTFNINSFLYSLFHILMIKTNSSSPIYFVSKSQRDSAHASISGQLSKQIRWRIIGSSPPYNALHSIWPSVCLCCKFRSGWHSKVSENFFLDYTGSTHVWKWWNKWELRCRPKEGGQARRWNAGIHTT